MTEADERSPGAAALTGAFNFRDLGGLPAADGQNAPTGQAASGAGGATLDFYLGHLDPGSPVLRWPCRSSRSR